MNKLKELFTKDAGWKLLSLGIALFLWFIVINIENPVETRTFNVSIDILSEEALSDSGFIISNLSELETAKTSIKVRGQRMTLERLSQRRNEIIAVADLSKIDKSSQIGQSVSVPIEVKMPTSIVENYEIISKSPSSINVVLDKTQELAKDVIVVTEGQVATGYVMGKPEFTPNKVEILGAGSDVSIIESVGVVVDVTDASKDIIVDAKVNAYDKDNNIVDNVTLSVSTINVKIPVNKSRSVVIEASTQGVPKPGYMLKDITWTPITVDIVGSEEVIGMISKISLPSTSIDGKSESFSVDYYLDDILPENISIKNGSEGKVTVNIQIVKEVESELMIPYNQIQIKGDLEEGYDAILEETDIIFYVRGDEKIVNSLDINNIVCSIDISGLNEGGHLVTVSVNLPEGVSIVGNPPRTTVTVVKTDNQPPIDENIDEPQTGYIH